MNLNNYFDISLGVFPPPWGQRLQSLAMIGFVLCLTVIVIASFLPSSAGDLEKVTGLDDKLAHFLAYAAVMGCAMWAMRSAPTRRRSFLILLVLSAFVEFGQPLLADGREGSLGDMLANSLGLIFGVGLGVWVLRMACRFLPTP